MSDERKTPNPGTSPKQVYKSGTGTSQDAAQSAPAGGHTTHSPKKRGSVLLNVLLGVCVCGVAVAIIGLLVSTQKYRAGAGEYTPLQNSFVTSVAGEEVVDWAAKLARMKEINPDCIGWIQVPGTKIDYPLVQTTDNETYLSYSFEKNTGSTGAIYLDAGCEPDLSMANSIIYGHHMKDGSMFAGLAKFVEKAGWLDEHKELLIVNEEGVHVYEVYVARQANVAEDAQQVWRGEDAEAAFRAAMNSEGANLADDDRVVTLVTCVNSYDSSDERYIVQAVLKDTQPLPDAGDTTGGA